MNLKKKDKFRKIYVDVNLDIDAAGFTHPKSIRMENGIAYKIESVKEYHRADSREKVNADCYSIIINGKERHLFFEKTGDLFASSLGRWFVAVPEKI